MQHFCTVAHQVPASDEPFSIPRKPKQSHQVTSVVGQMFHVSGQIAIIPKPELRALSAQMFGICIHLVHINSASDSGDSEYTIHPPTSSCCFATLAFENTGAGHWNLGAPQCQMKPHEPFGPNANPVADCW